MNDTPKMLTLRYSSVAPTPQTGFEPVHGLHVTAISIDDVFNERDAAFDLMARILCGFIGQDMIEGAITRFFEIRDYAATYKTLIEESRDAEWEKFYDYEEEEEEP